jgi:hypothetical protein
MNEDDGMHAWPVRESVGLIVVQHNRSSNKLEDETWEAELIGHLKSQLLRRYYCFLLTSDSCTR